MREYSEIAKSKRTNVYEIPKINNTYLLKRDMQTQNELNYKVSDRSFSFIA